MGMCVVPQFYFHLGYVVALWSRLAEIGIRTTFIVFTLIAGLLFEALDERIEKVINKSAIDQEYYQLGMVKELDEFRSHYDLLCQWVEQINRSFGFVLLIITGHDFATAIMNFSNILDHLEIGQSFLKDMDLRVEGFTIPPKYEWTDYFFDPLFEAKFIFLRSNPFKTCQFAHPVFRFLLLLVTSHRVGSKVGLYKMMLLKILIHC